MEEQEIIIEQQPTETEELMHKKSIRSLVLGILSLAFSGAIGIALGIVGIVQGNGALQLAATNSLTPDGRAKAGKILGIAGIVWGSIRTVWSFIKLIGFIGALIASIQSGSLGAISDWFTELGHSLL